jgi:hypothetical protein
VEAVFDGHITTRSAPRLYRVLDMSAEIRAFIAANEAQLKTKE